MRMNRELQRYLMLATMSAFAASAFGSAAEVKHVDAVPAGNLVRIEVDLTAPVTPIIKAVSDPCRLIIDFPSVSFSEHSQRISVNSNGVAEIRVGPIQAAPSSTRIVVGIDSVRPYGIETSGNKFVLSILPHPDKAGVTGAQTDSLGSVGSRELPRPEPAGKSITAYTSGASPQVEHLPLESEIEEPESEPPAAVRRHFKVKYIAGNTVYLDGGSNSGLRVGMNLDIRDAHFPVNKQRSHDSDALIATVRVIGVATTSVITNLAPLKALSSPGTGPSLSRQTQLRPPKMH
jgi:hypothetical protein